MRELTERDVTMFYIMESMKRLSRCLDKQVVCLIVDADGEVISSGVNTVGLCDKNCDDKEHRVCVVDHAEIVAIKNLNNKQAILAQDDIDKPTAYVSLFPCKNCQMAIDPYVKEIVTFGMIHKEWVSDKLAVFDHPIYKRLGEALYEKNGSECSNVASKAVADEMQASSRKILGQTVYSKNFYKRLNSEAFKDFSLRLKELRSNGLIAYTASNYKQKSQG